MDLCTVERKCSATGKACTIDDRACQNDAVAQGLEVTCEHVDPRSFIYCPPGGEQRDSSYVWILLLVAIGVAIVGGIASLLIFRRASKEG
jgi:hypothetical protein